MEKQQLENIGLQFRELYNIGRRPRNASEWTRKIKHVLFKIGHQQKYSVYAGGIGNKVAWGEWLWDVVWAKQAKLDYKKTGEHPIKKLVLICESEWLLDPSNIMRDFQKLTVGIAELKLYVYRIRKQTLNKKSKKNLLSDKLIDDCDKLIIPNPEPMPSPYMFIGIPTESSDELSIEIRDNRGVRRMLQF